MKLQEIVQRLQQQGVEVTLVGSGDGIIQGVSTLEQADGQHLAFFREKKYRSRLKATQAGAVILSADNQDLCPVPMIIVEDPYYVYACVAQWLYPFETPDYIHSDSTIHESARLAQSVGVMAQAVIESDVCIGEHSFIGAGSVIEQSVSIGKNCRIMSNVVIGHNCIIGDHVTIESGTVIGGDGFGWANHDGKWVKIPQVGRVIIQDNVSIGNNVCIDRGAIDDTVVEEYCIIDNMVHIAHNVRIGSGSAIAAQTGFAGSTDLGKQCTVAGQVGFSGHLSVVDHTHFFAKSGVTHSIRTPGVYSGFPAIPVAQWQKNSVRARNLDKMAQKIKDLEEQVKVLAKKN